MTAIGLAANDMVNKKNNELKKNTVESFLPHVLYFLLFRKIGSWPKQFFGIWTQLGIFYENIFDTKFDKDSF